MTRKIKIGLVGTGEIGRVHAQAHSESDGTEFCIAALIQPESEQRLAGQYAAPICPSFEALLHDDSVEAVDICLPNDLHCEFAVRALEAGTHVFCEKPLALTIQDADAMIAAARRAKRFLDELTLQRETG